MRPDTQKSILFRNFFLNEWMNGQASRAKKARKEELAKNNNKGVTKSMISSHKRANYDLKQLKE